MNEEQKTKNVVIAILCVIIFCAMGFIGFRLLTADRAPLEREVDTEENKNVNVMLERGENWTKLVDEPIVSQKFFEQVDGSTATIPITAELLRQFYDLSDGTVSDYFHHNTTHNAYENLIGRNYNRLHDVDCGQPVSLIFATYPSEEEEQDAADVQVKLEIEPVAMDGFVFITHKDNPVESLTVKEIKDIYSGRITNWKEVGGKDEEILAYQREANSGSQTAMERLVMQGEKLADCPEAIRIDGMGELVKQVAAYENDTCSIGYSYYYYLNNLYRNDNVKVIPIEGILPDNAHLMDKSYPFTTSYYAVMRADEPEDSEARRLRDFLLTEDGSKVIEMAGYCPVAREAAE